MAKVNDYIPIHYVGRRTPVRVNTGTETRVEQCHQETTNINKIVARYRTSGVLPAGREGRYEDVSEIGELLDVKMQISEMQNMYEGLPDNIKEKLPFADIGNVSDETLQELFTNDDHRANEGNIGKSQEEIEPMQDSRAAPGGAGENKTDPPEDAAK